MKSSSLFALIALFPLVLPACVAPESDSTVDEQDFVPAKEGLAGSGGNPEPPAGTNGDTGACLWASGTQDDFRLAALKPLVDGNGYLPAMPSIPTGCGDVVKSLVQCAAPKGTTLRDAATGDPYEGWWGLATEWLEGPLDEAGGRWVTACMIQKLNAYGVEVPILMGGQHTKLSADAALEAAYPFGDSTAFGNMFTSTVPLDSGRPPFEVFVCSEDDLAAVCTSGQGSPWLQLRVCDGVANCGMTFLGKCSSVCNDESGYWQCAPFGGSLWKETVRVSLEGFVGTCK